MEKHSKQLAHCIVTPHKGKALPLLPYLSLGLNYVIYWVRIYGNKTRSFMQDGNFIFAETHILSANEIQLLLTPQGALFFLNRSTYSPRHLYNGI